MVKSTASIRSRDATRTPSSEPRPPVIPVRDLMGDAACVYLTHAGDRYTLRVTRNNKLILTK